MRRFRWAVLCLVLAVAALTAIAPTARAQVLNALTPALLQARAWTFTALQTFGAGITVSVGNIGLSGAAATVDGKDLDLVPANARIVHICPSGCEYTSLNAACAGETSTAANPIVYYIHPGVYTEQASCSGEVSASFIGAGGKASKLIATGVVGSDGTLKPGDCKDCTFAGLYVVGHRAFFWDPADVVGGSGTLRLINNVFETETNGNDEDCVFGEDFGADTIFYAEGNECLTDADGFTFNLDAGNLRIISKGNYFRCHDNTASAGVNVYRLGATPALLYVEGDVFDCQMTDPSSNLSLVGFGFLNSDAGGASSGTAIITGVQSRLRNMTSGFGGSGVVFVSVEAAATNLTSLRLLGVDSTITANDAVNTIARNIALVNNTTDISVIASRLTSSGGSDNYDLSGGSTKAINVLATNYSSENPGTTAATGLDFKRLKVGTLAEFTGTTRITAPIGTLGLEIRPGNSGEIGFYMDNVADEGSNAASGYFIIANATTGAGDQQFSQNVDAAGNWTLLDDAFAETLRCTSAAAGCRVASEFRVNAAGAILTIGSGSTSDGNFLGFDAQNDALLTWLASTKELVFSGPTDSSGAFVIEDNMGLRLYEEDGGGTNYVELKGGATLAANVSGLPVTGSAVDTHGVLLWGDSSDAFDTGNEVCTARALTCVDVKTVAGVDSDCATDQGAATTHFYVLCK